MASLPPLTEAQKSRLTILEPALRAAVYAADYKRAKNLFVNKRLLCVGWIKERFLLRIHLLSVDSLRLILPTVIYGQVLSKKYYAIVITAALFDLGFAAKAVAVPTMALLMKLGLEVYCECYKPGEILDGRNDKGH